MAQSTLGRTAPRNWPPGTWLLLATIALEAFVLVGYFLVTPATTTIPRYAIYPFVWINVVFVAMLKTDIPRATRRHHAIAAAIAGAYFLLLANWGGILVLTGGGHHGILGDAIGLDVFAGSPMMARVRLVTRTFALSFIPYKVIGYLGLAYLVYVAVLDATSAVASGAIGLLSCLSCSFPIVASIATGVWGGSVTLMSTVYPYSVDISTVAFLLSVGLLYWRPGFPSLPSGSESDDSG